MADEILDVTRVLRRGMTVFPGDPAFAVEPVAKVRPGEPGSCAVSRVEMSTHCGTHVDAPAHFIVGGVTIDELPPGRLCVPALVIDARARGPSLDVELLETLDLAGASGLLFRTSGGDDDPSTAPFDSRFAHLTEGAARWIVARREIGVVGIDTLSIERADSEHFEVHHLLLGAAPPVLIVEGLDLRGVEPGLWEMLCLPLRIEGADGAPARVVLRRRRAGASSSAPR